MFDQMLAALLQIMEPANFLSMVVGVTAGIIIGALPGLTATMGIAVLIPLTFGLDPLVALGMMAGIYNGAMYGSAIPAILLRIPGTPSSIVTTWDGYAMAQNGEAGRAIQVACLASVIGSLMSALALILLAPPLARVAVAFGPSEYFWVAVFGLTSVALLFGSDPLKGILAAVIGLLISTAGIDVVSGHERLTFGSVELAGGFDIIVLLIGLYALPTVFNMAQTALSGSLHPEIYRLRVTHGIFYQFRKFIPVHIRASIIGIIIGILPGAGGTIAALISYGEVKRSTKNPNPPFGKGNPLGVAAAECANNADTAASLIPALTLGVPGTTVAAVILGGLLVHGLQPGPALFRDHPDVVYGFMLQMLVSSVLLFFIGGMAATRLFVQVLRIPAVILLPVIFILCVVGVYCVNNSIFDLYAMFAFGLVGYVLEKISVPTAPIILGVILGPILESNFRLTLMLSQGSYGPFFDRTISQIIIGLSVLVVAIAVVRMLKSNRGTAAAAHEPRAS